MFQQLKLTAPWPRLALIPTLVFSLAGSALARLGETSEQCIERYGSAVDDPAKLTPPGPRISGPEPDAVFEVGNYRLHCWFNASGKCDRIVYWHTDRAPGDRAPEGGPAAGELLRGELVHLLEINLEQGHFWKPLEDFGIESSENMPEREDYTWWRRTFAPGSIPKNPEAAEFSWWRRTFAPQTLPGYVPPPAAESGTGIRQPPQEPAAEPARPGPQDGAPDHDLAWISDGGGKFAIYSAEPGTMEILTRQAARRLDLGQSGDEGLDQL